jgi:hypothetical protein
LIRSRSSAQRIAIAAAAGLVLLAAAAPGAGAATPGNGAAATDAYRAQAPGKGWEPVSTLQPAGQLSWSAKGPGDARALLRLGYVGVLPADRARAVTTFLAQEQAAIRDELDARRDVTRGSFEADSMAGPGGLRWHGFRVSLDANGVAATSWRWIALHPSFPARRRAFVLSYDESSPPGATRPDGLATARRLAASVVPASGRGLAGPLGEAWLEARAAAFAARIDSAQRLCWRERPQAAQPRAYVGYGAGLALEGDFYSLGEVLPADSLVDAGPAEYGAVFDRNGDGRLDLLLVNRGLLPAGERVLQPMVAVYADEDFDGRIDALVLEDGDRDGDRQVDARLLVLDANQDGRADAATAFRAAAGAGGEALPLDQGRVRMRRAEVVSDTSDFVELFRTAGERLVELDRVRAACRKP